MTATAKRLSTRSMPIYAVMKYLINNSSWFNIIYYNYIFKLSIAFERILLLFISLML
jgi:hypothetical protein